MALTDIPAITWGAAFANTLNFGYPADKVKAYTQPKEGSSRARSIASHDSWIVGTDKILEFDLRYIPDTDAASPTRTGWTGSTGVRAFLEWARDGNDFRFIPDSGTPGEYWTCELLEPFMGAEARERDQHRRIRFKIAMVSATVLSSDEFTGY